MSYSDVRGSHTHARALLPPRVPQSVVRDLKSKLAVSLREYAQTKTRTGSAASSDQG